ncbi:hypothetical protein AB0N37_28440 [Streptomyces griseoincarnatus]
MMTIGSLCAPACADVGRQSVPQLGLSTSRQSSPPVYVHERRHHDDLERPRGADGDHQLTRLVAVTHSNDLGPRGLPAAASGREFRVRFEVHVVVVDLQYTRNALPGSERLVSGGICD